MATFSITGIQLGIDNRFITPYIANAAIATGEIVYLDTDGEVNPAVNTDPTKDAIAGVALQAADAGNICPVVNEGVIQVSNALTIGDIFILAAVAGDLMLAGDLLSTQWLSVFGAATATNKITIAIKNYEVQKA